MFSCVSGIGIWYLWDTESQFDYSEGNDGGYEGDGDDDDSL